MKEFSQLFDKTDNRGDVCARKKGIMVMRRFSKTTVNGENVTATPEQQEFSAKLKQARLDRGLSQSDLAREIWGEMIDGRGYTVAKNRGLISAYENGQAFPEDKNIQMLADALNLDPAELVPGGIKNTNQRTLVMSVADAKAGLASLQVNMIVPMAVAAQVVAILTAEGQSAKNRKNIS